MALVVAVGGGICSFTGWDSARSSIISVIREADGGGGCGEVDRIYITMDGEEEGYSMDSNR